MESILQNQTDSYKSFSSEGGKKDAFLTKNNSTENLSDPLAEAENSTFSEALEADETTVRSRKKSSAWAAAFNAIMRRGGIYEACNKLRLDPNEIKSIYLVMLDAAQRTEYLAEQVNAPYSKKRRFKASAATMELFFKRVVPPLNLDKAEKEKWMDCRGRQWRRRWTKIDQVQCVTGLGFFLYEKGKAASNKKITSSYTDQLSDLLSETVKRARDKSGEPITRYNRAADDALESFRGRFTAYKPKWVLEDDRPLEKTSAKKPAAAEDDFDSILGKISKLAQKARRLLLSQGISSEENAQRCFEMFEAVERAWTGTEADKSPIVDFEHVRINLTSGVCGSESAPPMPEKPDADQGLPRTPKSVAKTGDEEKTSIKLQDLEERAPQFAVQFGAQSGTKLDAALTYAAAGWAVFPIFRTTPSGRCTCLEGEQCGAPGKHPRVKWSRDASTDATTVRRWWGRWPDANIGIVTGRKSRLVVLDVDKGKGGEEALLSLMQAHGELPETLVAETGSGGKHLVFQYPVDLPSNFKVKTSASEIGLGLDCRGDGGMIVAAPSLHKNGQPYKWINPVQPAAIPEWLLSLIVENTARVVEKARPSKQLYPRVGEGKFKINGPDISEGKRDRTLYAMAFKMRMLNYSQDEAEDVLQQINQTRCKPVLPQRVVSDKARSAFSSPVQSQVRHKQPTASA